jgi:hypothetical protein
MARETLDSLVGFGLLLCAFGTPGCTDSGAGKAWSSLSVCAMGKSAQGEPAERTKHLRLIQLSHPGTEGKADAWPGRCATYANQLYQALDSSGNQASLKRSMQSKLGCSEGKSSCVLNNETLLTLTGELADGARAAELKLEPVPTVKEPEVTVQLSMSAVDWQPIEKRESQLVGPALTVDGRVQWLLKTTGERMRPTGCTFTPSGKQIECFAGHEKVPPFPPQSIQLVGDDKEIIAAGLTEQGSAAFNLKTGESVVVKGLAGNLVRDGLAVERGEGDKGYVAIPIAKGKAAKPIELKAKATIEQPLSLGSHLLWLEQSEGKTSLVIKSLKGNKLVDAVAFSGAFAGPYHVCKSAGLTAVGTWGLHTGQRGAKPTSGSDMTAVTITLLVDGAWTKPSEARIPFRRAIESDLVCSGSTATMAWAEPADPGAEVGQLTCDKSGCKTVKAKLGNVDSRWWWSVGPIGDKLLVLWRATLGEARMRLAPIGQLEQSKDIVLFDDQDHGGPKAGEAVSVFTNDAALLLFKQEPPVVLGIGADGSAKVLTAK